MSDEQERRERGSFERLGERIGSATGNAFGRGADRAMGMVGSIVGSAISSLGDWWSSTDADRAARSFQGDRERSCREHFESQAMVAGRDYDQVRPLYQFGHIAGQNPDYQGRDFSEVEPELRRAWGTDSRERHGDWQEVRGFVGFGYAQDERPRDVTRE